MGKPVAKPPVNPEVLKAQEPSKLQRFIRIVELPRGKGDAYQGYQPELIWVDGDKVVRRKMIDKPNLFEYAYTQAGEYIDPRNESLPE